MPAAIDALENALHHANHSSAVIVLNQILGEFAHISQSQQTGTDFYQQLTFAITRLFVDPAFQLEPAQYHLLCSNHASLNMAFTLAGFDNADHVFMQIAQVHGDNEFSFASQSALMKCLLLFSPNSDYKIDIHKLSEQMPELIAPLLIGFLGSKMRHEKKTNAALDSILEKDWSHLQNYKPTIAELFGMSNAWMFCSYSNHPKKHLIKKTLNSITANWEGLDSLKPATHDINTGKPKILIPLESFTSDHAMYRCFERAIRMLSEHYETVALCPAHLIDDISSQCFTQVVTFEATEPFTNTESFITNLQQEEYSIVYYPSLGMANFTLLLATQRIAPIQCFTLGHPATSYFEHIDYVIVQEQDFSSQEAYSETVILTGNETSSTINPVLANKVQAIPEDAVLNIAITSTFMKINADFLEACQKIEGACQTAVHFHVFPAASGHLYNHLQQAYAQILRNVTVYPATDYTEYLGWLSQCHIRLGTFPFGGANSNMDCFGLAMPFIALRGDEPHAHSDVGQLEQANLEELIADNIEDYIHKAIQLIDDKTYRSNIVEKMKLLKDNPFFNGSVTQQGSFVRTVDWIINNHDAIQQSGKKVWRLDEQLKQG